MLVVVKYVKVADGGGRETYRTQTLNLAPSRTMAASYAAAANNLQEKERIIRISEAGYQ